VGFAARSARLSATGRQLPDGGAQRTRLGFFKLAVASIDESGLEAWGFKTNLFQRVGIV
jgi:hypothetical protein